MLESLSPRARRVVNSFAYTLLVAVVTGLGYLTFRAANERRHAGTAGSETPAEVGMLPLLEIASFSARIEKSTDTERLTIGCRLRLTAPGSVDGFVYVLARNDHVSPKLWGIWPPQEPGGALSAGGHFRSSTPQTGEAVHLSPSWTRIAATIDHPLGRAPYDTAIVYVLSPKGEILLARPFGL